MKKLELNQMENVEGGLRQSTNPNCEWGIALGGAFVGGAFALATAGIGTFFVGIGFAIATQAASDAICVGGGTVAPGNSMLLDASYNSSANVAVPAFI